MNATRLSKQPVLAGAMLFLSAVVTTAAFVYPQFQFKKEDLQSYSLSDFSWVSDVKWGAESVEVPTLSFLEEKIQMTDPIVLKAAATVRAQTQDEGLQASRRIHHRVQKTAAVRKSLSNDQPQREVVAQVVVVQKPVELAASHEMDLPADLVDAYHTLRSQFRVAVNTLDNVPKTTHFAQLEPTKEISFPETTFKPVVKKRILKSVGSHQRVKLNTQPVEVEAEQVSEVQVIPSAVMMAMDIHHAASPENDLTFAKAEGYRFQDVVQMIQSAKLPVVLALNEAQADTAMDVADSLPLHQAQAIPGLIIEEEVLRESKQQPEKPKRLAKSLETSTPVAATEAPTEAAPSTLQGQIVVSTQSAYKNEYSSLGQQKLSGQRVDTQNPAPIPSPSVLAPACVRAGEGQIVQAFDSRTEVKNARVCKLSFEGSKNGDQAGWSRVEAQDQWQTITLIKETDRQIPSFSFNTLKLIDSALKTTQQKNTGIVFARLPKGWAAQISARSDRAAYFSNSGILLADGAREEESTVLFRNVEPGGHLFYLTDARTRRSVAILVPVYPGAVTHIPLSEPETVHLQGIVLDASSGAQAQSLKGVRVQVVGQNFQKFTKPDGHFDFQDVVVMKDYPLILESDLDSGFTHRYRVSRGEFKNIALYRFSVEQVQEWTDQLEGGISPQSGLVVAAVPEVLQSATNPVLTAVTTSIFSAPLKPETYSISSQGHLQVGQPLSLHSPRFLSVQLSDGLHVTELKNANGNAVWSQFVQSSPDVINVVRSR